MALFSLEDLDKEQYGSYLNMKAVLQNDIVSDNLDFSQFYPEVHSESQDSMSTSLTPEMDCWEDDQTSEFTVCKYCNDESSLASFDGFVPFTFVDSQLQVNASSNCDTAVHEMCLSNDLSTLDLNAISFDALDYEETGYFLDFSSGPMTDDACFQCTKAAECFGCTGDIAGDIIDRSICFRELGHIHTEQLASTNCCDWPNNNNNTTGSQNSCFTAMEAVEKSEPFCPEWPFSALEDDKDIMMGQTFSIDESSNTVTSVLNALDSAFTVSFTNEDAPQLNSSSLIAVDYKKENSKSENQNLLRLQVETESIANTHMVKTNNHSVDQRQKTTADSRQMSFISLRQQTESPLPTHMTADLCITKKHDVCENSVPNSSSTDMTAKLKHTLYTEKSLLEKRNSSHFSDVQIDKHSLASQRVNSYMKVGKRGRYVTLPIKNVNKLLVKDLLCISGNIEEVSIREKTQDYRRNIRRMLEQKQKRLKRCKC